MIHDLFMIHESISTYCLVHLKSVLSELDQNFLAEKFAQARKYCYHKKVNYKNSILSSKIFLLGHRTAAQPQIFREKVNKSVNLFKKDKLV